MVAKAQCMHLLNSVSSAHGIGLNSYTYRIVVVDKSGGDQHDHHPLTQGFVPFQPVRQFSSQQRS
jgi:hypothetical protein